MAKKTKKTQPKPLPAEAQTQAPSHSSYRKIAFLLFFLSLVCLLAALYFTVITVKFLIHPPHPISRQTNTQLIDSWMTLPYIARVYQIPEPKLYEAVGLKPDQVDRRATIKSIAESQNKSPDELLAQIRQTISDFQKEHPPRQMRKPIP